MSHHPDLRTPALPARRGGAAAVAAIASTLVTGMLVAAGPARQPVRLAAGSPQPVILATPAPAAGGASRADPVPFGRATWAGPLELRIVDAVTGPAAVAQVAAASPLNEPPGAGIAFVLVRLRVRNLGEQPIAVANNDFALTGASGIVHRFLGARPPEPALDATLDPGAEAEGWLVFAAPEGERDLLLLFDSLSLPGDWADRVLAVERGASIPDQAQPLAEPNGVGTAPSAPAGLGEPIVAGGWRIELLEVVSGAAVFDLVDFRTGALGAEDAAGADGSVWLALRLRVTNVRAGGEPSYLPANAFALADETGRPLPDVPTLTPPWPDASGGYYPGGAREGWVAFDVPRDYAAGLVRFLPYPETTPDPDPRFLAYL